MLRELSMRLLSSESTVDQRSQERDHHVATITGWFIMASAVVQLMVREGVVLHAEFLTAATILSLICISFLFLLRPQLGSYLEAWGIVSTLLVFITLLTGFTHVLANQGDWPMARVFSWFQSILHQLVAWMGGEGVADLTTSPLYLLGAFILLISFAYKSYAGFLVFIGCFLLYGLYPWNLGIVTAYLLWFGGFALLHQEVLYLPRALEERLHLDIETRDLLLEVRQRPLPEREVRFYLEGAVGQQSAALSDQSRHTLARLGEAGLLEYAADTGRVHPGRVLELSYLPAPVAIFVETASWVASWILLFLAAVYFMIPIDFLPEALLGPIGLIDDFIFAAVAALPLGSKLWDRFSGLFSRGAKPLPRG